MNNNHEAIFRKTQVGSLLTAHAGNRKPSPALGSGPDASRKEMNMTRRI